MRYGRKINRNGFTLIELSLAIAFISILLITITVITNEIIQIYRKGYSLKAVNQVGRDLIDEFQTSVIQSPPASISTFCSEKYHNDDTQRQNCESSNNGFYSVYQQYYASVKVTSGGGTPTAKQVPTSGIFCSGKYTYLWNTGYLYNLDHYEFQGGGNQQDLRNKHKIKVKYQYRKEDGTVVSGDSSNAADPLHDFRLIKVEDPSGSICASTLATRYPSAAQAVVGPGGDAGGFTINIDSMLGAQPEELLRKTDTDLVLYDLVVFEPARIGAGERLLFSGSFILGTVNSGVDIMSSSEFCKTPDYISSDFGYCAINKFNFTLQTSGK